MKDRFDTQINIGCRQTRKRFADLDERSTSAMNIAERTAAENHLHSCSRCAAEYRLFTLHRATLDAAAAPESFTPDEHFFRGLRARIARGPELIQVRPDESWAAALLLTARQMVPAMAVLLLLMIGATFLWNQPSEVSSQASVRPRERVVFSDIYDYPAPTRDDVLETLVAVEEK